MKSLRTWAWTQKAMLVLPFHNNFHTWLCTQNVYILFIHVLDSAIGRTSEKCLVKKRHQLTPFRVVKDHIHTFDPDPVNRAVKQVNWPTYHSPKGNHCEQARAKTLSFEKYAFYPYATMMIVVFSNIIFLWSLNLTWHHHCQTSKLRFDCQQTTKIDNDGFRTHLERCQSCQAGSSEMGHKQLLIPLVGREKFLEERTQDLTRLGIKAQIYIQNLKLKMLFKQWPPSSSWQGSSI